MSLPQAAFLLTDSKNSLKKPPGKPDGKSAITLVRKEPFVNSSFSKREGNGVSAYSPVIFEDQAGLPWLAL